MVGVFMIVRLNSDTNKIEVVIEKLDICRTCAIAYRCPKILDYINQVDYISTKVKIPYNDCWLWKPFDQDEQKRENTIINRDLL